MKQGAYALVVSAHPDDSEFGAAGTVALWTAAGQAVVYVVCTSGEKGSANLSVRPGELAPIREREQRDAADLLGVSEVVFLRHPDQGLDDTPGFRRELVRLIRTYRPEVLVTSDPYRRYIWHRDHRVVGQVSLDAIFPYARDHLAYPDLLEAGFPPHKVREIWFWGAETPNHRIDITESFNRKLEALRRHRSQVAELGIPDLESWMRERCRQMAGESGYPLAEAFYRVVAPP